jgi:aminoglycoside/choline kinase family phosphotransferase
MAAKGGDTAWVDNQERAFARWINEKLKGRGLTVTSNLAADLSDGLVLIALLEELGGGGAIKHNARPTLPLHRMENVSAVLEFLRSQGVKVVNIGPADIV